MEDQLHLPDNTEAENNMTLVFFGGGRNIFFTRTFPMLSRARNVSENAFGFIAARFRILHTPIHMIYPENINYVLLATCALHNFLRKRDMSYTSPTTFDQENLAMHEIQMGDWRENVVELTNLEHCKRNTPTVAAKTNRHNYTNYFNTIGKIHWQDEMITKGKA
ncbi:dde superfamily endonuclease [Holotrichia oblita]|uniref:Dde superfamily endonuclease n=1 Tax=Holotrichia oblita TaxID=644536 RepID=A0ACB9SGJ6_HOLOL|nr:dde superfamily endonuclease [Holotrichia oblita]